ncbi:MAG: alternative ribosome rescue aminoacyl-tRNA hydrolase ArfB [Wenzhouxiangellaceae bacterium]
MPPEAELEERFELAGGPGGQHVNRTESAVRLRFDARHSAFLGSAVRQRLLKLAGNRADRNGVITIVARESRDQHRNRALARERLAELIEKASVAPRKRIRTRPPPASRRKRLEQKRKRGQRKQLRRKPPLDG